MFPYRTIGTKFLWIIFLFWYSFKIWCISIRVSNPFIHWTKYLGPHHHYLFLPLFLGHEFSIHFRQNLFAMRSPAYGPNLAIWGSTPKNGLICEENLSQFQGNVQSCPKRLRHRWQNEICKYTRVGFAVRNRKKSSLPVTGLQNRGRLKDLNDSKLIVYESKWFPYSKNQ